MDQEIVLLEEHVARLERQVESLIGEHPVIEDVVNLMVGLVQEEEDDSDTDTIVDVELGSCSEEAETEPETEPEDDFDYENSCDNCLKSWVETCPNEYGVCECYCWCGYRLRVCRYECYDR